MAESEYQWSDEHIRGVYLSSAHPLLREFKAAHFDEWLRRHDENLIMARDAYKKAAADAVKHREAELDAWRKSFEASDAENEELRDELAEIRAKCRHVWKPRLSGGHLCSVCRLWTGGPI